MVTMLSAKAALLSALAAAIVYLNSLNGDFVFDDMPGDRLYHYLLHTEREKERREGGRADRRGDKRGRMRKRLRAVSKGVRERERERDCVELLYIYGLG
jgi:hypothetical protein